MDLYTLLQKKRPSQLTVGKSQAQAQAQAQAPQPLLNSLTPAPFIFRPKQALAKHHWRPDSSTNVCTYPGCPIIFGLFNRRHHCRCCGDIFCTMHCSNYLRLEEEVRPHLASRFSRGCTLCVEQYLQEKHPIKEKVSSVESSEMKRRPSIMTLQPQAMEGVMELGREDIVQTSSLLVPKGDLRQNLFDPIASSVPADWNWATF
ncbi:hypothetical protein BDF14DRAFT_1789277 [Spinellus fusiger]|nr:hypothetical protein BDF14DRAFT_1789277 [Spinellus fusiger]